MSYYQNHYYSDSSNTVLFDNSLQNYTILPIQPQQKHIFEMSTQKQKDQFLLTSSFYPSMNFFMNDTMYQHADNKDSSCLSFVPDCRKPIFDYWTDIDSFSSPCSCCSSFPLLSEALTSTHGYSANESLLPDLVDSHTLFSSTKAIITSQNDCSRTEKPNKSSTMSISRNRRTKRRQEKKSNTKEKPFKCCFCPITFARKYDLQRHIRVHTGLKPYSCLSCNKLFARTDALKRHLRMEDTCRSSPIVQIMVQTGHKRYRNL
ncbi:uncharacterized protein BX663DRAFT_495818 [Cokeromyces recurvatus]|uniref:uncharacterized protein n=1 Tax=Cokeromyces recurvatus TaxID=90255 RepID=UPI00221FE840|nr:uncharacterized protein BX663DRAFT_495818 [Cokeromyces recurvatus]KAI7907423.1 hypothetical protein BX663DRAFT_495818 [Cokeromyces recurvatus]